MTTANDFRYLTLETNLIDTSRTVPGPREESESVPSALGVGL